MRRSVHKNTWLIYTYFLKHSRKQPGRFRLFFCGRNFLNIAFYITGHGYGHAVRSIEVIKASLALSSKVLFHIRSSAAQWLFNQLPPERAFFHHVQLDAGAVQTNSFTVDKAKTLQLYADLILRKEELLNREACFLQEQGVNLIVSDTTPFAFDAAERAGLPAIGIGNFSWDWIYGDWIDSYPEFAYVIRDIRDSYSKASLLFRLPFHGDMSAFPRIIDVPLIGRKASHSKQKMLEKFALSPANEERTVLLALRENDMRQVNWKKVCHMKHFRFLTLSESVGGENITNLKEGLIPFEDLLNVSDAVISKPGYSIVSECVVNRTPILFVPRDDFIEDPILRQGLREHAVCEEMSVQAFYDGSWQEPLRDLFSKPPTWKHIRADGATQIAQRLLNK